MIEIGEGGEWPQVPDVSVGHVVEEVAARTQAGTTGSILDPCYVSHQLRLPAQATLPMRPCEAGTPLVFSGQVRSVDSTPLAGAEIDMWQADDDGHYSGFAPHVPAGNLRGVVLADVDGRFEIRSIRPGPCAIPTDGPTGELITSAGWHPAHLHVLVRAPGHRTITSLLYLAGDEHAGEDVAGAVEGHPVLEPGIRGDGSNAVLHDFVLEPV
jgi:catechol 1,2-dioxygenase